ncbi:hypothetical protein DIPPA_00701 [Diplonema papillatum]|nr:hypothetical protein DIPPA_00701 [Diplonema papillatum]
MQREGVPCDARDGFVQCCGEHHVVAAAGDGAPVVSMKRKPISGVESDWDVAPLLGAGAVVGSVACLTAWVADGNEYAAVCHESTIVVWKNTREVVARYNSPAAKLHGSRCGVAWVTRDRRVFYATSDSGTRWVDQPLEVAPYSTFKATSVKFLASGLVVSTWAGRGVVVTYASWNPTILAWSEPTDTADPPPRIEVEFPSAHRVEFIVETPISPHGNGATGTLALLVSMPSPVQLPSSLAETDGKLSAQLLEVAPCTSGHPRFDDNRSLLSTRCPVVVSTAPSAAKLPELDFCSRGDARVGRDPSLIIPAQSEDSARAPTHEKRDLGPATVDCPFPASSERSGKAQGPATGAPRDQEADETAGEYSAIATMSIQDLLRGGKPAVPVVEDMSVPEPSGGPGSRCRPVVDESQGGRPAEDLTKGRPVVDEQNELPPVASLLSGTSPLVQEARLRTAPLNQVTGGATVPFSLLPAVLTSVVHRDLALSIVDLSQPQALLRPLVRMPSSKAAEVVFSAVEACETDAAVLEVHVMFKDNTQFTAGVPWPPEPRRTACDIPCSVPIPGSDDSKRAFVLSAARSADRRVTLLRGYPASRQGQGSKRDLFHLCSIPSSGSSASPSEAPLYTSLTLSSFDIHRTLLPASHPSAAIPDSSSAFMDAFHRSITSAIDDILTRKLAPIELRLAAMESHMSKLLDRGDRAA